MLILIICGFLISIISNVQCVPDYKYYPKADGWFKIHKVFATWQEAFLQCHHEGAVLASPLSEKLLKEMKSLISNNTIPYFIGTHATTSPGIFVSVEGVPLENMPVSDMYQVLHSGDGKCLSMDDYSISVVSCLNKLPYICYRRYKSEERLTECGTFDKKYTFKPSTGSCYKVHRDFRTWPDANSLCISEGGYLTILNNEYEALVVHDMIDFPWIGRWDPLFIGLQNWGNNSKGTWLSIHGEPIEQLYSVWDDWQPDYTDNVQDCGALTKFNKLDDSWCNQVSFFVCEKDPNNIRYVFEDQTLDISGA